MDSLMAVEFKNNIQADLGISLDNSLIFDFPSLELLNDHLLNNILNDIINRDNYDLSITNNPEESPQTNIFSQDYSVQEEKQQLTIPENPFNWQLIQDISPQFYQFELSSEYLSLQYESNNYKHIRNPFFIPHEDIARDTITIEGRTLINYASYNYLGLAGSPDIYQAVMAAIKRYGTSASASRILSGEIPLHQELEQEIADFLGTEDCIVYIGGHTTNTTTIGHLFNKNDLILYDAFSHNSIRQGCSLSGATAIEFPHNDSHTLEKLLQQHRPHYEKVLIVIEGIYSTDGDIAPLPEIIELKKRYKTFLMVDEAHSIGVLGETGRGIGEYFNVNRSDVDLWMGTLSKSFVSCGGYIAASHAFVQYLKYTAPGFVFSVGMSPGNTAAALASLKLLKNEPERVKRLKMNVECFLSCAKHYGFDTGMSQGSPIVPIIVGESEKALNLSSLLYQKGINVLPMIYPSVPHNAARLRFFLTVNHTEEQIHKTCEVLSYHIESD
ncbi:MAG: aminotransferase class I/II-fold pyridoxal phosphate-dependent enzyme [Okeania sp. SIO3B5]|nr:aminotransferase class I/II-fold pyridoxal phosphate-dependent enzyme [Okeania sp. SIO3B5]